MRVWIFNPYDDIPGEGKAQRYWSLAQALAKKGHQVTWWSSAWSHRRKAERSLPEALEGNAPVVAASDLCFDLRLVPVPPYEKNVSIARVWNHWMWGRNLYRMARAAIDAGELKKPDLILASMPPMEGAMAALKLRKRYGCRVVTDIMDAWPETLEQALPAAKNWELGAWNLSGPLGSVLSALLYPYRRMLRRACAESDAVCAQSYAFAEFATKHGAPEQPYVCYLGAERLGLTPEPLTRNLNCSLRLVYLGAMGRSYDLETVVKAVAEVNALPNGSRVECVFVGDGEKRSALEAMAVPGTRFTGFLHGDELAKELADADIGLVPFFPESGVAVPYKAGEYLAYGLPLLSTIEGELGSLVKECGCGESYQATDVDGLAEAIKKIKTDPDCLEKAKAGAKACFAENFDRERLYPDFANWLVDGPRA